MEEQKTKEDVSAFTGNESHDLQQPKLETKELSESSKTSDDDIYPITNGLYAELAYDKLPDHFNIKDAITCLDYDVSTPDLMGQS